MVTLRRNGPFSSKQVLPVVSSGQPDFCRHLELMGGRGRGERHSGNEIVTQTVGRVSLSISCLTELEVM